MISCIRRERRIHGRPFNADVNHWKIKAKCTYLAKEQDGTQACTGENFTEKVNNTLCLLL